MQNTTLIADLEHAYQLLYQVAHAASPIVADIVLVNKTANFTTRATRSRIWLRAAIDLCTLHDVEIPCLRRVSAAERADFAGLLMMHVVCAMNAARELQALDFDIDVDTESFLMSAINNRLTPVKLPLYLSHQNKGVSQMFQRIAVAISIIALCLASVSCVAHAVSL